MRGTARKLSIAAGLLTGLALVTSGTALGAATGTFSPTGAMYAAREDAAAAPLPDGQALVAGGYTATFTNSALTFDPAGNFSLAYLMGTVREAPAAASLPDGRVLVAGGTSNGSTGMQSAEFFDPATNSFSPVPANMGTPRYGAAAAPLPDGRVLIAGGYDGSHYLQSAEVYNPTSGLFSATGIDVMSQARSGAAAAQLPDGRVLVAGGSDGSTNLPTAEIFDPKTNSFILVPNPMTDRRVSAGAAPLPDGRVLIVGGVDNSGQLASAETFDPATGTFSSAGIGNLSIKRGSPAVAALADGRVLVAGGFNYDHVPFEVASAELFSLAKPSNALSFSVKGKSLVLDAPVAGTVSVAAATGRAGGAAQTAKKKVRAAPSEALERRRRTGPDHRPAETGRLRKEEAQSEWQGQPARDDHLHTEGRGMRRPLQTVLLGPVRRHSDRDAQGQGEAQEIAREP